MTDNNTRPQEIGSKGEFNAEMYRNEMQTQQALGMHSALCMTILLQLLMGLKQFKSKQLSSLLKKSRTDIHTAQHCLVEFWVTVEPFIFGIVQYGSH